MPRVYVTQIPHRRDVDTNSFVPTVNIGPAAEHGEVVVMMPPQAAFHATADLVEQLSQKLRHYDYDAGDALIALGDPAIMAAAFAFLGKRFGRFTVLKWDRQIKRYVPARISV